MLQQLQWLYPSRVANSPYSGSFIAGTDLYAALNKQPFLRTGSAFWGGPLEVFPLVRDLCLATLTVQAVKGGVSRLLSFPRFLSFQIRRSSALSCPARQVNVTSSFVSSTQSDRSRVRVHKAQEWEEEVQSCSFPLDGRGLGNSVISHEERLQGFISCSLAVSLSCLHR